MEDQGIALSSISDIFLGRQTPELKAPIASAGATDLCFSITSRKQALHLRGESASVRTAFLAGIRHVWTKPTMVTQQTANIQAMTQGANFITVNKQPTAAADPAYPQSIDVREVTVFYEREDSKLGTLYWSDVGSRAKLPAQSLQLHRISDVHLGKQFPEMKGPELSAYPSHCCFSISAKEKVVHLIAPSEAVRTTWLAGIKDVFANVGKKATDARDSKDRKSRQSLPPQPTPSPTSSAALITASVPAFAVPEPAPQPVKPHLEVVVPGDVADGGFTPPPRSRQLRGG